MELVREWFGKSFGGSSEMAWEIVWRWLGKLVGKYFGNGGTKGYKWVVLRKWLIFIVFDGM